MITFTDKLFTEKTYRCIFPEANKKVKKQI